MILSRIKALNIIDIIILFLLFTALFSSGLIGCATLYEKNSPGSLFTAGFTPKREYSVSFDKMWKIVVNTLDSERIPIVIIDKSAGRIITEHVKGEQKKTVGLLGAMAYTLRHKYSIIFVQQPSTIRLNIIASVEVLEAGHGSDWRPLGDTKRAQSIENWLYEKIEQALGEESLIGGSAGGQINSNLGLKNSSTIDIKTAQKLLIQKGYNAGPIDGIMGRKTRQAIMKFQSDNGLPASGSIDIETENKLFGTNEPDSAKTFLDLQEGDKLIDNSADKPGNTFDHVHQFQNFFEDAPISTTFYLDSGLNYSDYDGGSLLSLGCRGGYPIVPKIEINAAFNLLFADFDSGDSEVGISDVYLGGKYNFYDKETKLSAGGFITLPIGSEDVGQGNFNFGAYCGMRHPLNEKFVITGNAGISAIEQAWGDDETSFSLAGGCIYAHSQTLNLIGEVLLKTGVDYMMASGGVDYNWKNNNKLRGALGLGFDDGAPNYQLYLSYLFR